MRYLLTAILLVCITCQGLADDEAKAPDFNFKSKKATVAAKKYHAANEKAEKASSKERKKNRLDLIMALEKERLAEMKADNLEGAIQLRDAIKALKKGEEPSGRARNKSKRPLVPDGVYHADYGHYPWVFEYHVKGSRVSCPEVHNDDGHSEPRNWQGKLRPLGENRVAVNWVHGSVPVQEIWIITDSHILIQQWIGNDDRSKLPRMLAVIWLDKK